MKPEIVWDTGEVRLIKNPKNRGGTHSLERKSYDSLGDSYWRVMDDIPMLAINSLARLTLEDTLDDSD